MDMNFANFQMLLNSGVKQDLALLRHFGVLVSKVTGVHWRTVDGIDCWVKPFI